MVKTDVFRGYGKIGELTAQTAVECRFGGEVETVLSAHASAALSSVVVDNGEVRYAGRALFSIVYEDSAKKVCRAEKGVEFSAKAESKDCAPAQTARLKLETENVSVRREGASVYVSALLGADVTLFGEQSFEYLTDGDLVMKRESVPVLTAHLCGGDAEADDEFETDFIGDVLMHAETVYLTDVGCETGSLRAEGEVNLCILALKGENGLVSFERLVPFRVDVPCEGASIGQSAEARVSVKDVSIRADSDEERGKCKIAAEISLSVEGCAYEETQIDAVTDAFSETKEIKLSYSETECTGAGEAVRVTERVSGKAALSAPVDFSDVFQAVSLQRAEANLVRGKRVEGVAMATLLVLGSDGSHRGVEISLPFSVPVETEEDCTVTVLACGASARQRQEGEVDAEATLKISLTPRKKYAVRTVCGAEEGAPLSLPDCAVSVYVPRAGDGLWELAKSLKKPPEEVSAANPDVEFPIREGQRVILYRKKELV